MKRLIIAKPGCEEFGNEVLNHLSIAAYGLEVGASVTQPFAYAKNGVTKLMRAVYARLLRILHNDVALDAWRPIVYLPPTRELPEQYRSKEALYFFGWLFRNPQGLEKYRTELLASFAPSAANRHSIEKTLQPLRGKKLLGIHMRLRPYKGFEDGRFVIPPTRVRTIVEEYIIEHALSKTDVRLVVVSDLPVGNVFDNFDAVYSTEGGLLDFHLLAQCSVIIGTNSTSSTIPAWFGNIPHIVTTESDVAWDYYRGKSTYFENKFATLVH